MITQAPPHWFLETTAITPITHRFKIKDRHVAYLAWGNPNNPPLIFIHGGFANAHWFAHIAPLFMDDFYVISLNLAGHGDSDWKDSYQVDDFTSDVSELVHHLNAQPPSIIAHSFGARVAFLYSQLPQIKLKSLILLDPPDLSKEPTNPLNSTKKNRGAKFYSMQDTILKRFKLIPTQPIINDFISTFIAKHSITQTEQGYRWKVDPEFFSNIILLPFSPVQPSSHTKTPTTLIFGQHSAITTASVRSNIQKHYPYIQEVVLKNAHHALMIDQPLDLVSLIKQNL
ncbi:MAG: alpha/beta hydrolase [Pseudomonadota bacterium]|nr:alpha/beta hydrolase [Pseudomonadota bacterium]